MKSGWLSVCLLLKILKTLSSCRLFSADQTDVSAAQLGQYVDAGVKLKVNFKPSLDEWINGSANQSRLQKQGLEGINSCGLRDASLHQRTFAC